MTGTSDFDQGVRGRMANGRVCRPALETYATLIRALKMKSDEHDMSLVRLSERDVRHLFFYYAASILIGLTVSLASVYLFLQGTDRELTSLISGTSLGLSGSGVFYSRKLYRACINSTYDFCQDTGSRDGALRRYGSLSFFLFRPLFALPLSIVILSVWRLGISASEETSSRLSEGFLYISLVLGFLSGFLAGRVLTGLEGYGAHRLEGMLAGDGREG